VNEGQDDKPWDICGFNRYKLFNKSTMREKVMELDTCPPNPFFIATKTVSAEVYVFNYSN